MDLELTDHVAIVTGASRGLGASTARALAAEGMKVVIAARSLDELEALAGERPEAFHAVRCDMTDLDATAALVDSALERFGRLDCVVNNAGIAPAGKFVEMDQSVIDRVFTVNVHAPGALARAAARYWISSGRPGSVINIASLSGLRGKATLAAYSGSKGAMIRMSEALSTEWARHSIRVNVIAPGGFETEAQAAVLADETVLDLRLKKIPMRRLGQPDEIGPLVCYLASDASGFVTGSCFVIDGGEVARL